LLHKTTPLLIANSNYKEESHSNSLLYANSSVPEKSLMTSKYFCGCKHTVYGFIVSCAPRLYLLLNLSILIWLICLKVILITAIHVQLKIKNVSSLLTTLLVD
jgi:hypothetical protein